MRPAVASIRCGAAVATKTVTRSPTTEPHDEPPTSWVCKGSANALSWLQETLLKPSLRIHRVDAQNVKMTLSAETSTPQATAERVLIVEDDSAARVGLEQLIRSWGFIAESASDGEDALEKVTSFRPAIVISDLVMPRLDGLGLLRALQSQGADVMTLLLTAQGTVETAVEAMKEGAYDYLTKPVDIQRLKILLDKIVERQETLREVKTLRRQLRDHGAFGSMIGNSPEMRKIYAVIEQAAPTERVGADHRRVGHGQGAGGADHPPAQPARAVSVCRHQLRRHSGDAARERDFRPRERRVHRRERIGGRAASSWPIAARCSSTRSAR